MSFFTTFRRHDRPTEQAPARVVPTPANSVLTAICLGLLTGFAGTMYHAFIWHITSDIYLPWGAVLGILLVFCAATWCSLRAEKTWAGSLVGLVAFMLIAVFGFAKTGSVLVLLNPVVPVGVAGTLWLLGTMAATAVSNVVVGRSLRRRAQRVQK